MKKRPILLIIVIVFQVAITAYFIYSLVNAGKIGFGLFSATYIGQRKGGEPHGYGISDYSEKVYVGEWKDGQAHGWGLWKAPGDIYLGEWKDGWPYGFGISDIGYERHTQYELHFSQKRSDQGFFKDQRRMEITFKENGFDLYIGNIEYDGAAWVSHGVWVNYEGDIYVGQQRDGLAYGPGTYIYADGTIKSGQWEAGKYVGP